MVVKEVLFIGDAAVGEDSVDGAEGRVGGSEEVEDFRPVGDVSSAKEEASEGELGGCRVT